MTRKKAQKVQTAPKARKPRKTPPEIARLVSKSQNLTPKVPKNEAEIVEPKAKEDPPSLVPAFLKANDTPVIKMPSPTDIATARKDRVMALASEALKLILSEMQEELAANPDTPIYRFDLTNTPSDVSGVIVNSLVSAGWRCAFDDAQQRLIVELPPCQALARPFHRIVSKVRPL